MKNITVSVDEDVYRKARVEAARQDTTVSALVKRFLAELIGGESEYERLKNREMVLREQVANFSASDRLDRDELHERQA